MVHSIATHFFEVSIVLNCLVSIINYTIIYPLVINILQRGKGFLFVPTIGGIALSLYKMQGQFVLVFLISPLYILEFGMPFLGNPLPKIRDHQNKKTLLSPVMMFNVALTVIRGGIYWLRFSYWV